MSSRQLNTARTSVLRPLRPPRIIQQAPHSRVFTNNSQLLLLARHTPRPQLPYLSQPSFHVARPLYGPGQHLARLLSTETRRFVREQTWLAVKWTAIGWTFLVLGGIAWFGVQLEIDERANPTPDEWNFRTRQFLRTARWRMQPQTFEQTGYTDWANIGSDLKNALDRLEDTQKQGKGLLEPAEGEQTLIPGLGKAGFDISAKSWPWRSGYFEVIMGCGRAAEHLDDMVLDKSRNIVFPKEFMVGPSNPDPRPATPNMKAAPLEENCVEPYPGPETFYMRVLTGKGFSTKQKLDAALAYAGWLDFKRLSESAEEMHKWAVDIAAGSLPTVNGREKVVDPNTGILKHGDDAQFVTPNLLRASTGLAIHYARNGNVSAALPILLSVLRARREAPVSAFSPPSKLTTPEPSAGSILGKIFRTPKFPPPPPTGDDTLTRTSKQASCDESELMLYIGEILFATSPASSEGVGWTRQAIDIAEANMGQQTQSVGAPPGVGNQKCKQCLITGVGNWEAMIHRLEDQSSSAKEKEQKGWFGMRAQKTHERSVLELQEDLRRIEELKDRIVREGLNEQLARGQGKDPSSVWIG